MGTIYKPTYTKPLPEHAKVLTMKGERVARIKPAKGRTQTFPVTQGQDGELRIVRTSKKYVAKYRDGEGIVRKVSTGCCDEGAARNILNELERRAELIQSGVLTASEDAIADHSSTPLVDHFAAFHEHRVAKGLNAVRIRNTDSRLARLADECRFRRLGDLSADKLTDWLSNQKRLGMSAGTRNEYRQELVGFGNWSVLTHRLVANPFKSVPKANAKADPQRQRRSLTEIEAGRLLLVAELRPIAEVGRKRKPAEATEGTRSSWTCEPLTFETLSEAVERGRQALTKNPRHFKKLEQRGRERALIYRTLLTTGLRRGELASLTIGSVELDVPTPFATLAAGDEKNRKGSEIPLRADLVAELREWIEEKREQFAGTPDEFAAQPLFSVPKTLLKVLNRDLKVAGIPKVDERGRAVDVHAMRMTFATMLSKGGVTPKVAQLAMRHSDIRLTMETYTDPKLFDVAGALDALPALGANGAPKNCRETPASQTSSPSQPGTGSWLVPLLVPNPVQSSPRESSAVTSGGDCELGDVEPEGCQNTQNQRKKPCLADNLTTGLFESDADRVRPERSALAKLSYIPLGADSISLMLRVNADTAGRLLARPVRLAASKNCRWIRCSLSESPRSNCVD